MPQDDAGYVAELEDRIRRLETRFNDAVGDRIAEEGGGAGTGSGGEWCEIQTVAGGGPTAFAAGAAGFFVKAVLPILDQSGGFTQIDTFTIGVPHGTFVVEWALSINFKIVEHPPPFTGFGWCLWTGGPCNTFANSVKTEFNSLDFILAPTQILVGSPGFEQFKFRGNGTVRRYVIKSEPGKDRLSLGMSSFQGFYPGVVDEGQTYGLNFVLPPTTGWGVADHRVKIVGVLDETP